MLTAVFCYVQPLKNWICTASEYVFETTPFCHAYMNYTCHLKTLKFRMNSIFCKIFIYIHKNLFAPQAQDLLEKLAEILLYNFHCKRILLKLKTKKLLLKISSKVVLLLWIFYGFFFCIVFAMSLCESVYMCFVVTCWERVDLLALVWGVLLWICHFPIGILGQV